MRLGHVVPVNQSDSERYIVPATVSNQVLRIAERSREAVQGRITSGRTCCRKIRHCAAGAFQFGFRECECRSLLRMEQFGDDDVGEIRSVHRAPSELCPASKMAWQYGAASLALRQQTTVH